ncbi:hypothetical protein F5984_10280 [Rudanella paleaurantiibacter]|uniref:Prolyl-tRNA synthetase n=1 Tax=Rudanella paleaurantiibacter TaxID=2614655 RepID=A0A7J5U0B1_9BACT|nr:hypothetical protein [Rudanella paleaurantiibacter]KAB7731183.1 hypothetical protein F5984_10280 [Rudanella paleaurantiibacter]
MKTQRTWPYLSLAALMGLASCTSSRQTAQNAGEMDDLYGSSANAVVYEGNRQSSQPTESYASTRSQRQRERDSYSRNTNPDYVNDEQRGYDPNRDDYYTELSTRNVKRGLSADPGWNTGSYNDGFTDGYYAGIGNPAFNSTRWNPWGWNNGFNTGLSIGLGVGTGFGWGNPWGWNSFNRFGYGGGFYDPFWGGGFNSFAYSPWGYGGGFYDPFWGSGFNRFGYGGFGYSPWGGGWNRPVIVSNTIITGADPYRATRTYGARGSASNSRYNDNFNNTPRNYNPRGNGGRTATGSATPAYGNNTNTGTSTGSSDSYYARPRNTRGTYYYESGANNTGTRGGSTPSGTYTNPNGRTGSSTGGYYSAPRENSRGTYTPRSGNSTYESRPSYNQPSYQAPQRSTYESRPSYSQPSQSSTPSYSAPSSGGSRGGGGGSYSGGGGGGSRGPR